MAAAAVLLAGASLLASGGTSGAVPVPASGSAFGVSADGLIDIAPTPTAPPDETVASINQAPLIETGILTAMANLDEATGDFTSAATVANFTALADVINAGTVSSTCRASGTELTGDSTFLELAIVGALDVPVDPPANTVIDIPRVATVFLNEQVTSPTGRPSRSTPSVSSCWTAPRRSSSLRASAPWPAMTAPPSRPPRPLTRPSPLPPVAPHPPPVAAALEAQLDPPAQPLAQPRLPTAPLHRLT